MSSVTPTPDHGILIVISSPSGGGKTTVIREVRKRHPELGYSVSCTTRKPRPGEIDGKDYIFLTEREFQEKVDRGEFLEWEWVHDHRYGTLKETVAQAMNAGKSLLFDIDVHGAKSLKKAFPKESLLIFLSPPDLETLKRRLNFRAEDSPEEIEFRLKRISMEMQVGQEFEVVIINDVLSETIDQVIQAIDQKMKHA